MEDRHCVQVLSNLRNYRINKKKITLLGDEISHALGVHHYETCIQLVSPKAMRDLNFRFRKKDSSTDVLSFPQLTWKRPLKVLKHDAIPSKRHIMNRMPLGDIVISLDDAAENATESGHGLDREVCFLLVHGFLHLVGHDHMKSNEKRLMFTQQDKLMDLLTKKSKADKKPLWNQCAAKLNKNSPSKRTTKHHG